MQFRVSVLIFLFACLGSTAVNAKTEADVDKCIMSVTAQTGIFPDEEARRKTKCFYGARDMVDKCERTVGGVMRVSSHAEQAYRKQCRQIAK